MLDAYLKAKRIGEKAVSAAMQNGERIYLPCLSRNSLSRERIGICEVSSDMIVGTVHETRARDFAPNFMPIADPSSELAGKWSCLYDIQMEEGIRDPVKVYEDRWNFYVEEGNKRVSVLKYLDVPTIECEIIRLLPEERDPAYEMFRKFFRCTRSYIFRFEKASSYEELASIMDLDLEQRWPREEVQRLTSAYYRFYGLFTAGREDRKKDAQEAFLGYLKLYPLESLTDLGKSVLTQRVKALGEDLPVLFKDESIPVTDKPAEAEGSLLKSLVTKITAPTYTEAKPLQAAFVYRKDSGESAWVAAHERGRLEMERSFAGVVKTSVFENLRTDEGLTGAIDDAIASGANVIFTVSADDFRATLAQAADHPEVRFCNCSLRQLQRNVLCYYPKTYEAKYLMGAIAAVFSEDHKIGLLADYPLYGMIADINAFALGASLIDPKTEVYLKWATLKGIDWREEMWQDGLKVISGHSLTKPYWGSEEQGLFLWSKEGNKQLASIEIDWGEYYRLIIEDILEGRDSRQRRHGTVANSWYGLASGIVRVNLTDRVPEQTKNLITLLQDGIIRGELDPFAGKLFTQDGTQVKRPDGPMDNDEIIGMQWLSSKVHGIIPEREAFVDSARELLNTSGVWNDEVTE